MKRFTIAGVFMIVATWAGYGLVGHALAVRIAARLGPKIVRAGDGKFTDAAFFLQNRFFEVAWLLTLTIGVMLGALWVGHILARRVPRLWQWVPHALASFIAVNVWIKLGAATCLFWCLFWNGKGTTDNFAQFHIKLLLLEENHAPVKVALGGSSQVRAQIDHRLLNQQVGSNIFSTELHFPANRGYDFLFLHRELSPHKANVIVCYLSELNFYARGFAPGFSLFFKASELPDFLRLGGKPQWLPRALGYAFLGNVLPVFQLRDALAQRFVGTGVVDLHNRVQAAASATGLAEQAVRVAAGYEMGPQSKFQMAAFEEFIARCRRDGQTVVLCCGQLNPLLSAQLDPALRPQMMAFLHQLAARNDHVILLEGKALPEQTVADYEDLTHVNHAAQIRFTEAIGRALMDLPVSRAIAAR